MRPDIKKTTQQIADFLPGLISGANLEFFSKANITNSQFIALMAVHHSDGCTMSHLAKVLHVSMPTVTGLVDRLVKLGLVQRIASTKDRRKVYIYLSRKGEALIAEFKGVVRQRWATLLVKLSRSEVAAFLKVFEKLHTIVRSQRNEAHK